VRDEGLAGMTALGRHLLETGQLRPGLDLAEVRDALWNYLAIDHYERLVLDRGWSLDRYERWLAEAITSALCPSPAPSAPGTPLPAPPASDGRQPCDHCYP